MNPVGLPVSARTRPTKSSNSATSPISGCPVRAQRRLALGDAPDRGDFGGHLGGGQDAALARLGALAELDLEHLDLVVRGDGAKLGVVKQPVGRAHSVIGGADLEHEIAPTFQMAGRQAALAGIDPGARDRRALGQRAHRGKRDRAVAHRRDIEKAGAA